MKIINNLNGTHKDEILDLIKDSDEFILVSPFLMNTFDNFLSEIAVKTLRKITLITTIKDNQPELFKKVEFLKSFRLGCIDKKLEYAVHVNNDLHGKVYIAKKNGIPVRGIITSANFTDRGLSQGHEWGVEITNREELQQVIEDIFSVTTDALSNEAINKIIKEVNDHPLKQQFKEDIKVDLRVSHLLNIKTSADGSELRYFIKPVGSKEQPYTEQMHPKSDIEELHFVKKPVAVRPGDILICYGVIVKKLLGYFEVTSEYKLVSPGTRWPWGVEAKNLLPEYSEKWEKFDNTLAYVQDSYAGRSPVTMNGGNNLNSLMYGQDKIRLTEEFALHLIETMKTSV